MKRTFNYLGQDVTEVLPELLDDTYGFYNQSGQLVIKWKTESETVDAYGFDKTVVTESGHYIEEIILPKGICLCRYGLPTGRFTALTGTPYENLALPYRPETIPYMQYIVIADGIRVKLQVKKGMVAPMFGSAGRVLQFMHYHPINIEVDELHLLEEDWTWLKNMR